MTQVLVSERPTTAWWVVCGLMTAFMVVLVPVYLVRYGPTNFLYFCDISLVLTTISLWCRWSLPASMALVGILLPQALWILDFISRLFGFHFIGMTDYLFDESLPLYVRGLSLFHLWLPLLLCWMVWRLGYDRRGFLAWLVVAIIVLPICWLFLPPPPAQADNPHQPVNVNLVYGFDDSAPQQWMSPTAWFCLLFFGLPLIFWYPTHWLLQHFMPPAPLDQRRTTGDAAHKTSIG